MDKTLGKEYENKMQRIAFLKDNCDGVENKGYMKPYTPEELQGHKEKTCQCFNRNRRNRSGNEAITSRIQRQIETIERSKNKYGFKYQVKG